jgi:hypothetical protein
MKGKKYSTENKIRVFEAGRRGSVDFGSVPRGEHLGSDVPPVKKSVSADGAETPAREGVKPAPLRLKDKFILVLRRYWPSEKAPSILDSAGGCDRSDDRPSAKGAIKAVE